MEANMTTKLAGADLPPSFGAELAECAGFAFAFHLVFMMSKSSFKLTNTDAKNVAAFLHSIFIGVGGLLIAWAELSRVQGETDPIKRMGLWRAPYVSPTLTLVFHGEMGYYLWDTWVDLSDFIARGPSLHGLGYLVHHLVPLSLLAAIPWRQRHATHETEHLVSSLLTINISTWLLVILSAARKRGHSTRMWYRLSHLCFMAIFFAFRLYGVWWTLEQRADRWAEWETLEGRAPPAGMWDRVLGCVQTKCLVGTAILTVLNLTWLGLNFRKAFEIWGLKPPRALVPKEKSL
eukprot:Hpha_TRINITY_DN14002_c1_g1::TRINITY_DN14002_c1_g1_i1::g.44231::m.44231